MSVERITVCNVIEKLAKHDILFLATLGKPPIPTLFKFWPLLLNLISKDTNRKILAKRQEVRMVLIFSVLFHYVSRSLTFLASLSIQMSDL